MPLYDCGERDCLPCIAEFRNVSPYLRLPLRSLDEAVADLKAKQAVAHEALTASHDRRDRDPLAGTAWALFKTIDEDEQ